MAMLINDNDTLKKYVPNTLKAVAGELSLFDKIQYHLLQAEQWLTATFVSSDTMSRIRSYSDSTPLLHYCRIITAAEAMLHAVPQLDLILTPNGFGIVSNQNVIPASKERIERLLLSLEKTARRCACRYPHHASGCSPLDCFGAVQLLRCHNVSHARHRAPTGLR